MPLRIGCDLDGVLADMDGALRRHASVLFPEHAAGGEVPDETTADDDSDPALPRLELTQRQQRSVWRHVRATENFWETLEEIEAGAVARLYETAAARQWEIIFLTKRPATIGLTAQVQSQRWLEAHGFQLPSVYVVNGSRGHIASALALDVVIDDTPENCLDVATDSRARVVAVFRDDKVLPPAVRRLGVQMVRTVEECLAVLCEMDRPPREPAGPMRRLLKSIGLGAPAAV